MRVFIIQTADRVETSVVIADTAGEAIRIITEDADEPWELEDIGYVADVETYE